MLSYSLPTRGLAALAAVALASCSTGEDAAHAPADEPPEAEQARRMTPASPETVPPTGASPSAAKRVEAIAAAIDAWRRAASLAEAKRHAEAARNLIVGPDGPGYGDSDGDGTVAGANTVGLLPGLSGGEALAIPAANVCVTRDLLGGDWSDPRRRWAILADKIAAWRPGRNNFPTLPSHAQRIVGWASLALAADDVAVARDYAGHADLHVAVSADALERCKE